jgi:hypothetical protein
MKAASQASMYLRLSFSSAGCLCCCCCCSGNEVARGFDEYDVSDRLKEHGWVLPAYTMAPKARHVKLLRAVIR